MERFITIVFILVIFFWALGKVLPYLLTRWVRKRFGQFGNTPGADAQDQQNKGKEGDVYVEQIEKQEKFVDKNVGEYVDFEEKK